MDRQNYHLQVMKLTVIPTKNQNYTLTFNYKPQSPGSFVNNLLIL